MALNGSSYLDEAAEILDSVRGKPQTVTERKRLSIELAALLLKEASKTMTSDEKAIQEQLTRLMRDPVGKAFTTAMTDQCFRSHSNLRIADQIIYLLSQMGIPQYLDTLRRLELASFKSIGPKIAQFLVTMASPSLRTGFSTGRPTCSRTSARPSRARAR